ncbi:MAG TPA: SGNH/GDSL hydrolase family protein [Candidatus Acidoferrum sp.]|nr:SGNH/GDSL hydrolase family protein [Candidatus Acidoferrum sp.]
MHSKTRISRMGCGFFLMLAVSGPAFGQTPAPASTPAQETKAPDPHQAFWESRNPYEKSLVEQRYTDWSFLAKYRDADKALPPPASGDARVVFLGDSITEAWGMKGTNGAPGRGVFFPGKPYVNRGISGQTSPQMLVRFRQDVIELKPKVVVILAGTNDIAENTGQMTQGEIAGNITSMSELARANGIHPVLCSVLPSSEFWWHKGLAPAPKIRELNAWIKDYAAKNGFVYVDYYSPMVNAEGGLKSEFSPDGVHPNAAGYGLMAPLAEAGIAEALKKS